MPIDIKSLNAAELKELAKQIEKRVVEVEKETLKTALKEMHAIADKLGVSFEAVIAMHRGKDRKSTKKSTAKNVNPDNRSQTWTGRGRQPLWIKEALNAGKSIDDLRV